MRKGLIFMEEKYQDKFLPWFTYLGVPMFVLYMAGYLLKGGIGGLLKTTAVIIPFTSIIVTHLSLKYGGRYILSVASLGGLSFGLIIRKFNGFLTLGETANNFFAIFPIILMGIFVALCSRRKFSERSRMIRMGMSMMVTFTLGAILGIILALILSFLGRIGAFIGFFSGIFITVVYLGAKLGGKLNLGENEIYSPKCVGLIGAGVGGWLALIINKFYMLFNSPFYYEMNTIKVPLTLVINLIAGLIAGLLFGYFSQKIKKNVDEEVSD